MERYAPSREDVAKMYKFASKCFGWYLSIPACIVAVTYARKNQMVQTFKDPRMNTIIKQIGSAYREVMDY